MSGEYQIERSITGSTSQVVTETGLIKSGEGVLRGLLTTATSSGTIALYDGLETSVGATSTLTWANGGSSLVPALHGKNILTQTGIAAGSHAASVLTVSGAVNFLDAVKASGYITASVGQPTAGDTIVLGDETYTFIAAGTNGSRFDVPLGSTYAITTANLFTAMSGNPLVDVVHTSTYVITVTAKTAGTAGNIVATEDATNLAWDDGSTLTGGLEAETITIQGKTYTWRDVPKEANDVKIAATSALSLVNLKYAINATAAYETTNFGVGTIASAYVAATASDATTLTITARIPGVTPNAYTTTETCASAAWAGGTMTNGTAGVASTTATVTVGDVVYTYVTALSENIGTGTAAIANQVLRGSSVATGLANLRKAINASGTIGTDYSTGTVINPYVVASASDATTLTAYSRTVGNAADTVIINALSFADSMADTAWASVDFGTGTGAADAAVTSDDALLTIGSRVYTVVNELSETSGATAVVDQILFGANDGVFLDNIKKAINATGTAGTEYSTGTTLNTDVIATTNAATTQVIAARTLGVSGNSIATGSSAATYSWTSTVMGSGTGLDSKLIMNTLTPAAGSQIDFNNIEFERGLYAIIGGTSISTVISYK